jgi:integrase
MPKMTENTDGTWSARADYAAAGEPRDVRTVRRATRRELAAELARIQIGRHKGELMATAEITVNEMLDAYLADALQGRARNTHEHVTNTLRLVREVLGDRQARKVRPDDIRQLIKQARESGRHARHDEFWTAAAQLADRVRRAGPRGISPAALIAEGIADGRPDAWTYQTLRRLARDQIIRQIKKGLWAPMPDDDGRAPTDPETLRPPTRAPGLQADTVRYMISRLSAAYDQAIGDGKLARNPCQGLRIFESRADKAARKRPIWNEAQIQKFVAYTALHRLSCCWHLTSYGLRRGEVLGLKWDDIDWQAETVHIQRSRVREGAEAVEKPPKSELSDRVIPLDRLTLAVLRTRKRAEAEERLAAGPAWTDSGFIAVDQLGEPIQPESYSIEFKRICTRSGLVAIRLTDVRHSANSAMAAAGVPPSIRGLWLGNSAQVNERVYTHARPEDIEVARQIIHGYMDTTR